MPRPVTHLAKFKRVEASIRDSILTLRKTVNLIDEQLGGNRTDAERKVLERVKIECDVAVNQIRQTLVHLYEGVEQT